MQESSSSQRGGEGTSRTGHHKHHHKWYLTDYFLVLLEKSLVAGHNLPTPPLIVFKTVILTYHEEVQSVATYPPNCDCNTNVPGGGAKCTHLPLNYNYNTNFQEGEKSLRTNLSLPSLTLFTSSTKALRSPVASLKADSAVTFSYFLSAIHNCVKFQDLSVY